MEQPPKPKDGEELIKIVGDGREPSKVFSVDSIKASDIKPAEPGDLPDQLGAAMKRSDRLMGKKSAPGVSDTPLDVAMRRADALIAKDKEAEKDAAMGGTGVGAIGELPALEPTPKAEPASEPASRPAPESTTKPEPIAEPVPATKLERTEAENRALYEKYKEAYQKFIEAETGSEYSPDSYTPDLVLAAKEAYEKARGEYVASDARRFVKSQIAIIEMREGPKEPKGRWERIKEAAKRIADINLGDAFKENSKAARLLSGISVRNIVSAKLLGLGAGLFALPAMPLAAGYAATVGVYKYKYEKNREQLVDTSKLNEMKLEDIAERISSLNVLAKYRGSRKSFEGAYQKLRDSYETKMLSSLENRPINDEVMSKLDNHFLYLTKETAKEERAKRLKRAAVALAWGIVTGGAVGAIGSLTGWYRGFGAGSSGEHASTSTGTGFDDSGSSLEPKRPGLGISMSGADASVHGVTPPGMETAAPVPGAETGSLMDDRVFADSLYRDLNDLPQLSDPNMGVTPDGSWIAANDPNLPGVNADQAAWSDWMLNKSAEDYAHNVFHVDPDQANIVNNMDVSEVLKKKFFPFSAEATWPDGISQDHQSLSRLSDLRDNIGDALKQLPADAREGALAPGFKVQDFIKEYMFGVYRP